MPHHGHGILWNLGDDGKPRLSDFRFGASPPGTVPLCVMVGQFKAAVTKGVNRMRSEPNDIWHRNDWEHVIRDEADPARIRRYIREKPEKWCHRRFPDKFWGRRVT